ncbi:MAG: hypothetical protein J5717_10410 [Lachnospiraceae bacterium]|nr:hypothetical protein [Lachnospiraceae bacterium]
MTKILAIIGIVGGLLCACADLLLDLKGADNKKLGGGTVESKWATMAHWRFVWSAILAMFAVPMYTCGFVALMQEVAVGHKTLATVFMIIFLCGAMGGFMIHTFLCVQPTVFKTITAKADTELAVETVEASFRHIYVPFFTLYSMLVIVPAIAVVVMIITDVINAPLWCVILNPVVFQLLGFAFRATKLKIFIDAPSCCAASLGLAMYGVLALIAL